MSTIKDFIESKEAEYKLPLMASKGDGLLLGALKYVFRCECYDFLCRRFCSTYMWCKAKHSGTNPDTLKKLHLEALHLEAIDVYTLLWIAVMAGLYAASWWFITHASLCWMVVFVALIVGLFRVIEIGSFLMPVLVRFEYVPASRMRSIILTSLNYWEVVFFFSNLFLVANVLGDTFGMKPCEPQFNDDVVTPVYFSFVTITTLGYGDYSPVTSMGKLIVMAEILCGLIFVVVVLQRILSAQRERSSNGTAEAESS